MYPNLTLEQISMSITFNSTYIYSKREGALAPWPGRESLKGRRGRRIVIGYWLLPKAKGGPKGRVGWGRDGEAHFLNEDALELGQTGDTYQCHTRFWGLVGLVGLPRSCFGMAPVDMCQGR